MKRVSAGVGDDRRGRVRPLGKRAVIVIEGASESGRPKLLADRLTHEQRERLREQFDDLLERARRDGVTAVSFKVVVKAGGENVSIEVPVEG